MPLEAADAWLGPEDEPQDSDGDDAYEPLDLTQIEEAELMDGSDAESD